MSVLIEYSGKLVVDMNLAVKVLCKVCSSLLRLKSITDMCVAVSK